MFVRSVLFCDVRTANVIPSKRFSNFCRQIGSTVMLFVVDADDFVMSVGINDFIFGSIVLEEDEEEDDCSAIVFVTVTLFVIVGLNCEEWSFLLYEAMILKFVIANVLMKLK